MPVMTLRAIQLSQQEGPDEPTSPLVVYCYRFRSVRPYLAKFDKLHRVEAGPQLAQITSMLGFVLLSMMPA